MKKRLRKKKHLAEFTEWGVHLTVKRSKSDDFDQFFDDFIDMIEANDCYCGGGGSDDHISMIVELGQSREVAAIRLENIKKWLDARDDVKGCLISEFTDLWNGDESEWDRESERSDAFLKE